MSELCWNTGYWTLTCHSQHKATLFFSHVGSHLSQASRPKKNCRAVFLLQGSSTLWVAAEHYKGLKAQGMATYFQLNMIPQLFAFHSTPMMEIPFSRGSSQGILTCQWQVQAASWHALFIALPIFCATLKAPSLYLLWTSLKPGWKSGLFCAIWQ